MKPTYEHDVHLRRYLLNDLPSDEAQLQIEERLLTDEDYVEQLLIVEEDLIDDYVRDNLSPTERAQFESRFLCSPERRQKIRAARALKHHLESLRTPTDSAPTLSARLRRFLQPLLSPPVFATAAVMLVLSLGVANWWLFFRQTDTAKGVAALRDAYRESRPVEARITGFAYARFLGVTTQPKTNVTKLKLADGVFRGLAVKDRSPAALHALGKFHLTEKNFNEAVGYLQEGIKADANDATMHVDLAVALMERARTSPSTALSDFRDSRRHLEEALRLDRNSLEASFNLALLAQTQSFWKEAEDGWRRYLEKDSTSEWAAEAKDHLRLAVEKQKPQ